MVLPADRYEHEDEEAYQRNERAFRRAVEMLRVEFPKHFVAFVDGEFVAARENLDELAVIVEDTERRRSRRFYAYTLLDYERPSTLL